MRAFGWMVLASISISLPGMLGGCATQKNASTSDENAAQGQTVRPMTEEEIQAAQRRVRENEFLEIIKSANLVAMADVARARIRATSFGEVAQIRFEGGDLRGSLEAIELALESAAAANDPRLETPLLRTRYLILRYTALEKSQSGDIDGSLRIFDRLALIRGLTDAERSQVASDRLLLLESRGDADEKARNEALSRALARMLDLDTSTEVAGNDTKSDAPWQFDPDRLRRALSEKIGKEVKEAKLPVSRDTPTAETGAMDQGVVLRVVSQNKKGISTCYSQSLKSGGAKRGRLELALTVDPNGSVRTVGIKTEAFRASTVGRCIADSVLRWKFPPFEGSARDVELPFVLDYLE